MFPVGGHHFKSYDVGVLVWTLSLYGWELQSATCLSDICVTLEAERTVEPVA